MQIIKNQTIDQMAKQIRQETAATDDAIVAAQVADMIKNVRENGDEALKTYSATFDGVTPATWRVSEAEIQAAMASVPQKVLAALRTAAENIRTFHQQEVAVGFEDTPREGIVRGVKVTPLSAVGIYVPGGTAAYPSSVLMNAIPAKIAGVPNIVMVTPPQKDGLNPTVLAAAKIAGVDQIFQVGGAQAIAALAYGTATIPAVDKITGPGNRYVAMAKKMVYGQVAIDMIAGPSEIGILADDSARPADIAADLLSQAEHDVNARVLLMTTSAALATAVNAAVAQQLETLPRADIARAAINDHGVIYLVNTIDEMFTLMNLVGPEHLEVQLTNPAQYLAKIQNAGSIFLGPYASEPLGDYFSGPNHILPTGGTARFSSPLGVWDFQKRLQYLQYTQSALAEDLPAVTQLARAEGLEAHARAVQSRFNSSVG
ncbi:histidinol dehydrogenase [Leuconostoc holzapfelii]|uniref:Histidinol dehydrogenase n=1 Tax=Leuconostoc holzapfelii TaxID=434464 RepID=A0ABT2NWZ5_9LACO|nr:histidinol dehydrogenase [Leuconostoc holzapfelii]MCT8388581.1 histidinol dehydrogenase [Leuconostoc holzapfelii]